MSDTAAIEPTEKDDSVLDRFVDNKRSTDENNIIDWFDFSSKQEVDMEGNGLHSGSDRLGDLINRTGTPSENASSTDKHNSDQTQDNVSTLDQVTSSGGAHSDCGICVKNKEDEQNGKLLMPSEKDAVAENSVSNVNQDAYCSELSKMASKPMEEFGSDADKCNSFPERLTYTDQDRLTNIEEEDMLPEDDYTNTCVKFHPEKLSIIPEVDDLSLTLDGDGDFTGDVCQSPSDPCVNDRSTDDIDALGKDEMTDKSVTDSAFMSDDELNDGACSQEQTSESYGTVRDELVCDSHTVNLEKETHKSSTDDRSDDSFPKAESVFLESIVSEKEDETKSGQQGETVFVDDKTCGDTISKDVLPYQPTEGLDKVSRDEESFDIDEDSDAIVMSREEAVCVENVSNSVNTTEKVEDTAAHYQPLNKNPRDSGIDVTASCESLLADCTPYVGDDLDDLKDSIFDDDTPTRGESLAPEGMDADSYTDRDHSVETPKNPFTDDDIESSTVSVSVLGEVGSGMTTDLTTETNNRTADRESNVVFNDKENADDAVDRMPITHNITDNETKTESDLPGDTANIDSDEIPSMLQDKPVSECDVNCDSAEETSSLHGEGQPSQVNVILTDDRHAEFSTMVTEHTTESHLGSTCSENPTLENVESDESDSKKETTDKALDAVCNSLDVRFTTTENLSQKALDHSLQEITDPSLQTEYMEDTTEDEIAREALYTDEEEHDEQTVDFAVDLYISEGSDDESTEPRNTDTQLSGELLKTQPSDSFDTTVIMSSDSNTCPNTGTEACRVSPASPLTETNDDDTQAVNAAQGSFVSSPSADHTDALVYRDCDVEQHASAIGQKEEDLVSSGSVLLANNTVSSDFDTSAIVDLEDSAKICSVEKHTFAAINPPGTTDTGDLVVICEGNSVIQEEFKHHCSITDESDEDSTDKFAGLEENTNFDTDLIIDNESDTAGKSDLAKSYKTENTSGPKKNLSHADDIIDSEESKTEEEQLEITEKTQTLIPDVGDVAAEQTDSTETSEKIDSVNVGSSQTDKNDMNADVDIVDTVNTASSMENCFPPPDTTSDTEDELIINTKTDVITHDVTEADNHIVSNVTDESKDVINVNSDDTSVSDDITNVKCDVTNLKEDATQEEDDLSTTTADVNRVDPDVTGLFIRVPSVDAVDADVTTPHLRMSMEEELHFLRQEVRSQRSSVQRLQKALYDQQVRSNTAIMTLRAQLRHNKRQHQQLHQQQQQQLASTVSDLLMLEGRMRQEQRQVLQLLHEKDGVIQRQNMALDDLGAKNDKLMGLLTQIRRAHIPSVGDSKAERSIEKGKEGGASSSVVVMREKGREGVSSFLQVAGKEKDPGHRVHFGISIKDTLKRHKSSQELHRPRSMETLLESRPYSSQEYLSDGALKPSVFLSQQCLAAPGAKTLDSSGKPKDQKSLKNSDGVKMRDSSKPSKDLEHSKSREESKETKKEKERSKDQKSSKTRETSKSQDNSKDKERTKGHDSLKSQGGSKSQESSKGSKSKKSRQKERQEKCATLVEYTSRLLDLPEVSSEGERDREDFTFPVPTHAQPSSRPQSPHPPSRDRSPLPSPPAQSGVPQLEADNTLTLDKQYGELAKARSIPLDLTSDKDKRGQEAVFKPRPRSLPEEGLDLDMTLLNVESAVSLNPSVSIAVPPGPSQPLTGANTAAAAATDSSPFQSLKNVFRRRSTKQRSKKRPVSMCLPPSQELHDQLQEHFKKYDLP